MIMNIDEDILNIVKSLLGSSKKDKFEADIYSSDHPKRSNLIFHYNESVDILNKSRIFLDKQKSVYSQPEGGYSTIINPFTQYHVIVARKKLIDYFLKLRDKLVKEPLSEDEQIRKLISLILEKQLKSGDNYLFLVYPLNNTVEEEIIGLQLGQLLKLMRNKGLIKISKTNFKSTGIEFSIEVLEKLKEIYRERGGYIKTKHIGTSLYHVDPITGDFSWNKKEGVFLDKESYQLKVLIHLIEHKSQPVSKETIYIACWNKKISKNVTPREIKEIRSTVKNTVGNLRKKLGITNRKDSNPGNINGAHHKYTLYL